MPTPSFFIYLEKDTCWVIYFEIIFQREFSRFQYIRSSIMIFEGLRVSALQMQKETKADWRKTTSPDQPLEIANTIQIESSWNLQALKNN